MVGVGLWGSPKDWIVSLWQSFFCDSIGRFRSWHYSTGASDHKVVILQLDFASAKTQYPFKFNPYWLVDGDFNAIVNTQWVLLQEKVPSHFSPLKALQFKLEKLRPLVRSWERVAKKRAVDSIVAIEEEIISLENDLGGDLFSLVRSEKIKDLFARKHKILLQKEETPRQQSCAIWLRVGDDNSKYFHQFANKQRILNSI